MEAILAKLLASKLGLAVGGTVAGIALGFGLKILHARLPGIIAGFLGKQIELALTKGDPADDELILAVMKWVEVKIPTQGQGSIKMDMVIAKLTALIPPLKGKEDALKGIVQAVFDKSKDVIAEHRKAVLGG